MRVNTKHGSKRTRMSTLAQIASRREIHTTICKARTHVSNKRKEGRNQWNGRPYDTRWERRWRYYNAGMIVH